MDRMVVLGSASPRRKELLESWGFTVLVVPPPDEVERAAIAGEDPDDHVRSNASLKFRHVAADALHLGRVVLTADTVVALGGKILGKAGDEAEAARMLDELAGREHVVHTGVCIGVAGDAGNSQSPFDPHQCFVETARVRFRELNRDEIASYLVTGEWRGRAGAYSVQDRARTFVAAVTGEIETVIGLPRARTQACLQAAQADLEARLMKRA